MILEETAKYLKIGRSTLYKMAREGKIPAVKVMAEWRFKKDLIDRWIEEKSISNVKRNQNEKETH